MPKAQAKIIAVDPETKQSVINCSPRPFDEAEEEFTEVAKSLEMGSPVLLRMDGHSGLIVPYEVASQHIFKFQALEVEDDEE